MLKKILLVLTICFPFSLSAAQGDYCLGEWAEDAHTYCNGIGVYIQAVATDRKINRPKGAVEAEIPLAVKTYVMPAELAQNIINFVYQYEPEDTNPQHAAWALFGGCIDNYENIMAAVDKQAKVE